MRHAAQGGGHRLCWALLAMLAAVLPAAGAGGVARGAEVFVEAEMFAQRGGWVLDPQFMDLMGSPYLLAHGLGVPVADATTTVEFPSAGTYRVFVRTMDWVARWKAPGTPGRFQVLVGGKPLAATFGTEGAAWHWQDGGRVEVPAGPVALALHDLTGFEGRCDALLFTTDARFVPPNRDPQMDALRRRLLGLSAEPQPAGEYDLVVVGGGIAGTCAAVSAARLGLAVALVQDRPLLGGNNSSEVRVWLQGARNKEPWPRVGDIVAELEQARHAHYGPENTADLYEDAKKLAVVRAEPKIRMFLDHRVNAVEAAGGRIRAVIAQDTVSGRRIRLAAALVADCTGDGAVGVLAGTDFEMTPQGHMGPCNLWNVIDSGSAASFPPCPWALPLADKPFPGRSPKPDIKQLGGWYWESGFDHDPMAEMEYVRDWNFRAMYGAWDALKNVDKTLPNHRLNWSAYIMGKRESRRLLGDVILTKEDLLGARQYPDGCVPTGWSMDLHLPDPKYVKGFEGDAFISKADFGAYPMPFWVPYRCLYSRNVANLFMAGRDISVTHEALGAVRVMRTGGCMGEIVGMAASLCRKHDAAPRAVYEKYLLELQDLMRRGVGKAPARDPDYVNQGENRPGSSATSAAPASLAAPVWLKTAGDNLARAARVTTCDAPKSGEKTERLLNDGAARVEDNAGRWICREALPHWVEFTWDAPVRLGAARIISGYTSGGAVIEPIRDFSLQWHDGTAWKDIPGAAVKDNSSPAWAGTFDAVTATRLRLVITATKGDTSRIWEVEFYAPVEKGQP